MPRTIQFYYPIASTMNVQSQPIQFTTIHDPNGGTKKILFYDLPVSFISGLGPKYIHIRHVMALYNGNIPNDIKMHSSVVSLAPYDDSFACFANQVLARPKKFACESGVKSLSFWFRDCYGNEVDIDGFVIELMLEYVSEI
jgi:hypothetical protein